MKLFHAHPQFTGRCQFQPRPADTQSSWYLDIRANYTDSGFIDAPEQLPSGSVRAVDVGDCRLMLAHVRRENA